MSLTLTPAGNHAAVAAILDGLAVEDPYTHLLRHYSAAEKTAIFLHYEQGRFAYNKQQHSQAALAVLQGCRTFDEVRRACLLVGAPMKLTTFAALARLLKTKARRQALGATDALIEQLKRDMEAHRRFA